MKRGTSRRSGPLRTAAVLLTLASLSAAIGCASVRSTSATQQPAAVAAASSAPSPYVQQALYRPISGACRATIRPDRAVIVGGISASGIKPTETSMRLNRQIDVLQTLADEEVATLHLVERIRAARPSSSRSRRGGQPDQDPYVVVQRIELETGIGTEIDRLLEKTLQAGLDRYGSAAGIDVETSRSRPLVVYRFGDLEERIRAAHDECRHATITNWCEARAGADTDACVAALEAPEQQLSTEHFMLTSQPVTLGDGSVDAVQVMWPYIVTGAVELGGDAELRFSGAITLRLAEGLR